MSFFPYWQWRKYIITRGQLSYVEATLKNGCFLGGNDKNHGFFFEKLAYIKKKQ